MTDHHDGADTKGPADRRPRLSPLVPAGVLAALVAVNVAIVEHAIRSAGVQRRGVDPGAPAAALGLPETGRGIYMTRCFWCHGEEGRGDGPSAVGMIPRPRDFIEAAYRIRSTPHGQLPTDDDLLGMIADGAPGTPMPGWKGILGDEEIRRVVAYIKSFSPRFATETIEPLAIPSTTASARHGKEIYEQARCFMCHGDDGRGDGGITVALDYQWGLAHPARDLTRGWTFKGGHDPRDIYLRITGGLNGTPMGPYRDLLGDQDRWDLAHYLASLDREPSDTSADFVVTATLIDDEVPPGHDAPQWRLAPAIMVPLAGQVVLDPPSRWWTPTTGTASIRALVNSREIGFLVEWNDPTGHDDELADAAMLQFAAREGSKPYFLLGSLDDPVVLWRWSDGPAAEEWTATGAGRIESRAAKVRTDATWDAGRWRVVFKRALQDEPGFGPGRFVPMLLSIQDGANAEMAGVRAISTWFYVTAQRPGSVRPWLVGLAFLLWAVIVELWIRVRPRS